MKKKLVIVAFTGLVIGLSAWLWASYLPSRVHFERTVMIGSPPRTVFAHLGVLVNRLNWNGIKGRDSIWVEEWVKEKQVTCGLMLPIGGMHRIAFTLLPVGDSTRLTSNYTGDMEDLRVRLKWLLLERKAREMQSAILNVLKKNSERDKPGQKRPS